MALRETLNAGTVANVSQDFVGESFLQLPAGLVEQLKLMCREGIKSGESEPTKCENTERGNKAV